MKLTKAAIDRMVYERSGNAADLRWDDELPGFAVRVFPSGRKSFVVKYRTDNGTARLQSIGSYGELTLHQARDLARNVRAEVRKGKDPLHEKRMKRAEPTVADFFGIYEKLVSQSKRSWPEEKRGLRNHILPELGSRKLSSITTNDLARLQTRLLSKPVATQRKAHADGKGVTEPAKTLAAASVNRCMAVLKHMLNVAKRDGYIAKAPAAPRMLRAAPPRDIVLSPEECRAIMAACDADNNQHVAALFKLAMLTGRRIGELRHAKWGELDEQRAILRVPVTKAGEQQFVLLSDDALGVIRRVKRVAGNPFIFAGTAKHGSIVNYKSAWRRILERAGVAYIPVHGLRHNAASMLVAAGVPLLTVGRLLGHKDSRTTEKYAHHRGDQLRQASGALGNLINFDEARAKRVSS